MIKYLEPINRNSENKYKYIVDCESVKLDKNALDIQNATMRDKHIIVLEAVISDIAFQNKKIVVKIGETNRLVKREYDVAKKLETSNIPGYIRMECLFQCGHNIDKYRRKELIDTETFHICETQKPENVDVLIMPYIGSGISLYDIGGSQYKNIIKQVLFNSSNAFLKTGFVHKDLHFGNVLIDENENAIIMDFDTSEFVDLKNPGCVSYFWSDMLRFFGNVSEKGSFLNTGPNIYILSNINMIYFMINTLIMTQSNLDVLQMKVNEIISYIMLSDVITTVKPNVSLKYDPSVFGGKKKTQKRK
jgi:hypothetical protein